MSELAVELPNFNTERASGRALRAKRPAGVAIRAAFGMAKEKFMGATTEAPEILGARDNARDQATGIATPMIDLLSYKARKSENLKAIRQTPEGSVVLEYVKPAPVLTKKGTVNAKDPNFDKWVLRMLDSEGQSTGSFQLQLHEAYEKKPAEILPIDEKGQPVETYNYSAEQEIELYKQAANGLNILAGGLKDKSTQVEATPLLTADVVELSRKETSEASLAKVA